MKGIYMKTSKYSSLSKQDLIEILEKIPDYIIYDYVREMCEKAFDERSEAYLQELKKIEQLKKEIQKRTILNVWIVWCRNQKKLKIYLINAKQGIVNLKSYANHSLRQNNEWIIFERTYLYNNLLIEKKRKG
jgi:hypothetical protein